VSPINDPQISPLLGDRIGHEAIQLAEFEGGLVALVLHTHCAFRPIVNA
jgi:hypothetical protein